MEGTMRTGALLAILTTWLALAGCGGKGGDSAAEDAVTVELRQQNGSGQFGTATLTPEDDSATKIVIELNRGTGDPQPTHIHAGTCAKLDPQPKYGLDGLVDGMSRTIVPVPLSKLTNGRFAINVHKSDAEAHVYVVCGAIGARPSS
jgi:hypothetical protein